VWAGWSECDVTCGSGSRSRTRTCDNPPPANGGEDCVGTDRSTDVCVLNTCPGREYLLFSSSLPELRATCFKIVRFAVDWPLVYQYQLNIRRKQISQQIINYFNTTYCIFLYLHTRLYILKTSDRIIVSPSRCYI